MTGLCLMHRRALWRGRGMVRPCSASDTHKGNKQTRLFHESIPKGGNGSLTNLGFDIAGFIASFQFVSNSLQYRRFLLFHVSHVLPPTYLHLIYIAPLQHLDTLHG
jgi:hypothetical protein